MKFDLESVMVTAYKTTRNRSNKNNFWENAKEDNWIIIQITNETWVFAHDSYPGYRVVEHFHRMDESSSIYETTVEAFWEGC